MTTKKKESQHRYSKPAQTVSNIKPLSDKSKWNITLGVITAFAAILAVYLSWLSYKKSLPDIRINKWEISNYSVDNNNQVTSVDILIILSNTGGSDLSIVDAKPKLAYQILSHSSNQTPSIGLDLRGGLQTMLGVAVTSTPMPVITPVETTIALGKNTRIVAEFPGIYNPEQVVTALQQTGLLEFVDMGSSTKPVCAGDTCSFEFTSKKPDVFFSELGSDSQSASNLPITIASGKSVAIIVKWQLNSLSENYHFTDMSIILVFSNGASTEIQILDKFKN